MPCITIPLPNIPALGGGLTLGIPRTPEIPSLVLPPLCCIKPIVTPAVPSVPIPGLKALMAVNGATVAIMLALSNSIHTVNSYLDSLPIPCPND